MAGVIFTRDGLEVIHEFIRLGAGSEIGSFFFGNDSGSITTDRTFTDIDDVYIQKPVTWEQAGNNSKFTVGLTSIELLGSYINRGGLTTGSLTIGSLMSIEESIVGSKTNAFTVEITGEIILTPLL